MILTWGTCAFLLDPVLTVFACEAIWEPWQGQVNCTPISYEQAKSALSILSEKPTEYSNEETGKEDGTSTPEYQRELTLQEKVH